MSDEFRWLPICDRCLNNSRNPHLRCAIHPFGITSPLGQCPEFELDPAAGGEECWEPEGASFYADELIITPEQRWTRAQKLELLDWHPVFTGRCPNCERSLFKTKLQPHWDCPHCHWKDDSL
jgi:hypothetical protein